ncbi:trypsin-like peptidase domain-containing protein [Actibacterium sp. 188UL27-1]|uniref:trypsin-like peptidase domain-containing protein n=1 Tax=Actibacterium sp. 188UL27-1 TaxID=2786961 RepID=UPI00351C1B6D
MIRVFVALLAGLVWFPMASAQAQQAWLQVEAQPTLAQAQSRAQAYTRSFPNVSGFRMPSGWYAIALGPYTRPAAEQELASLRRNRLIPRDSFIAFSNQYRQQFWPVGGRPTPPAVTSQPLDTAQPDPQPLIIPDETPREARNSERLLTREERLALQEALQWGGFYTGGLDGAFGRGTRAAMEAWQLEKGFEPTGVLTTKQRETLLTEYRAVFAALGLRTVRDTEAGIEMTLPAGMISRARVETPFVHYDSTTDDGVRVLLISQQGDQRTLFGLYDIMQTLEIVPQDGERNRSPTSFTLTGQGSQVHSYTFARLAEDTVKGFTVAWKPEDARLMNRVVEQMKESFSPISGAVLPDAAGDGAAQQIDLVSGLNIRRPDRSRSGFYIDTDGTVLTTTDVLGQCDYITLGGETRATVTARDNALGVAVLTPVAALAPPAFASFQSAVPRLRSEVAVSGFSYEDVLDLPTITFGTVADIRGLNGEDTLKRLDVATLPADAGGPVLDQTGSVIGMLRAAPDNSQRALPKDVQFSVNVSAIASFLINEGIQPAASDTTQPLAPEDLTTKASDFTVRVSCWN